MVTGSTPVSRANLKARAIAALAHKCERCGAPGATLQSCRTQYADPKENVDPVLCRDCAEEHHDYWDAMWAEYFSSSGVMNVTREQMKALRAGKP